MRGQIISELKYKKPSLFSAGYIQFGFKQTPELVNNQFGLITAYLSSAGDSIRMTIRKKDKKQVEKFLAQLSEDIDVRIATI